jgi:hypothetical protein
MTLFIEFPATYQWAGSGNQLATSKGTLVAILTVECLPTSTKRRFSSPLLAVGLMVNLVFTKEEKHHPFG